MIAVFADIHANIQAFAAVLDDARRLGAAEYWLLGDLVDYGANPNETIELARTLNVTRRVGGNHDAALFSNDVKASRTPHGQAAHAYTKTHLNRENAAWLKSGSLQAIEVAPEQDAMLTHGSPENPFWGCINPDTETKQWSEALEKHAVSRLFVGHSHLQFRAAEPDGREIVNPGSVGQPRNGNPLAQYAVVDNDNRVVLRQVPYDVAAAAAAIRKAGLPEYLAERLFDGK